MMFFGKLADLIHVDAPVLLAHAILDGVEPLARLVGLGAVRQVPAAVEAHPEDRVARRQQRLVNALVRLAAGIGLHIDEADAEELLGALDGERLGDVHELAAAIVALARIALGIFIGHDRALRFEHRF